MRSDFSEEVIAIIREIPKGKVATYGRVAEWAGNPRAARQVARALSSCSEAEALPWWRVLNKSGAISLPPGSGFEEQRDRLAADGVEVIDGRVDLQQHAWKPEWMDDV